MNSMELISQGAEGKVYKTSFHDRLVIVKERVSKRYRAPELGNLIILVLIIMTITITIILMLIIDRKLTRQRLLQEARCMVKCRKAGVRLISSSSSSSS